MLIRETENENCQEEIQSELRKNVKEGILMIGFDEMNISVFGF